MIVIMKYWLYKSGYAEYEAYNYNKDEKTVEVKLPDYHRPKYPKDWRKTSYGYITPNGYFVRIYGSGFGENYFVEATNFTLGAGLKSRQKIIDYIDGLPKLL